jgi:imidazolonepropionase-like amidohydrolase
VNILITARQRKLLSQPGKLYWTPEPIPRRRLPNIPTRALAGFACFWFCASVAHAASAPIAITGVNVIDVTGGTVAANSTVVITRDRIVDVGKSADVHIPRDAQVVDGSGKFLIPGLWDMHVHMVFGDWFPQSREITLPLFVANGITGVRDMGGELDILQQWRKEITQGKLLGPRIVTSGPMLDGPKPRFPSSVAVASPEDGRRAVDDLKRRGADFIKLQSLMSRESYFAIAGEAKKRGMVFAGHVPDAIRAMEASNAGQKSIEHLTGVFEGCSNVEDELLTGPKGLKRFLETFDDAKCAALIAVFAKNRTWQAPTLVWERGGNLLDQRDLQQDSRARYVPASWKNGTWRRFTEDILKDQANEALKTRQRFVAKELEVVRAMYRAGIPFLAGTDTAAGVYVFPGFSLHEELQLFVQAGFTPLGALQCATRNPAEYLGKLDEMGTVEKGKVADLVLLDANPLDDIANTQRIAGVIAAGRYLSRAGLDQLLRSVEAAAAKQRE